ncbi:MAG: serine hydrolase [Aggregatilineales bacterium]
MLKKILLTGLTLLLILPVMTAQEELIAISESAATFITENPDDVAIYCVDDNNPDNSVFHNIETPFPVASTYKIIILAELARQYDAGLIDIDEQVALNDVNLYWQPDTDGGAHQAWLDASGLEADDEVSLRDVAYGMISVSSNAATDYLLRRLGTDGFEDLYDLLTLENTDVPHSTFLGLFLLQSNHETGEFDLDTSEDNAALYEEMQRLEDAFVASDTWRDDFQAYLQEQTFNPDLQIAYMQAYSPKVSAGDMMTVMDVIYEGDVFSDDAVAFMDETLGWVFDVNPANAEVYETMSTKGGSLASIATAAWYVDPIAGDPYHIAVFYQGVPMETWIDWQSSGAQQILELRVFAFGEGCTPFVEALGAEASE